MSFAIPQEGNAAYPDQTRVFQSDLEALAAGIKGERGVISGCAVTAQATPNMTVAVASGSIRVGSVTVAVTSGNVTIEAAGSFPRFDLIVVDSAGAKTAIKGTQAAVPKAPDLPTNRTYLAQVYVPQGVTAITTSMITSKRVPVYDVDAAAGTASPRTLGTGATSAAAGNHLHDDRYFTEAEGGPWGIVRTFPHGTNGATLFFLSANEARYARLYEGGSCSKIGISVVTSAGNVSVAAYTNSGVGRVATPGGGRLATSGSVPCPAAGYAEVSLGATIAPVAGDWFGFSCDSTASAFQAPSSGFATNSMAAGMGYRQTSAHPLPSSPSGLIADTSRQVMMIGVA